MDDRGEPAHGGRGGLPGNAVAGLVLLIVIGVFLLFGRGQRSRRGARGGGAGDGVRDGDRPT